MRTLMMNSVWILGLLGCLLIGTRAQDVGSLFDLISTFASSSHSPNCPGECRHALSALFCSHVMENVDCGEAQLKCCIPEPEEPPQHPVRRPIPLDIDDLVTTTAPTTTTSTERTLIPMKGVVSTGFGHSNDKVHFKPSGSVSSVGGLGQPISIVANLTILGDSKQSSNGASRIRDKTTTPAPLTSTLVMVGNAEAQQMEQCPGMCVPPLIAAFCSNILDDVFCEGTNRCCTTEETPLHRPPTTIRPSINTTKVLLIRATTTTTTPAPITTTSQPMPITTEPSMYEEDLPSCEGSCVAGLLSLLCDDIDPHGACPGSQRCCVVRRLTTTTPPPITNCPGFCMPTLISGMCMKPSKLIPETLDCEGNTICCDNNFRDKPTTSSVFSLLRPRPQEFTLFPLLPAVPTQPAAPKPQPPPSFVPNVDRTQNERAPCPGSCIASFLSFTCFGTSVVLPGVYCPKENLICCAPKSVLQPPPPNNPVPPMIFTNNTIPATPAVMPVLTTSTSASLQGLPSSNANKFTCGVKGYRRPETARIMGGRDSTPGEWCWQIALINSMNQYLCGGALIGKQWVLTAAHCVTNLVRSGDPIYVRVGDYDLTNKYGSPGAQTLKVSTTYVHHNHNSQTLDNNIALLKLTHQVELKEGICPICLPARGIAVQPGKRCIVTGYGYMGETGPIPLRIREVELPIIQEQECVRKINAVTEKVFILPASSYCGGGEDGSDACQGDGGGPMACEVDGYYELTGIVSWGFGCGRSDVPGVYVKVSSFIGWINQIISVNNS